MREEKFVIIGWPDIQDLMDLEGFKENSHLINDEEFLDTYGYSCYFVSEDWLDSFTDESD